MREKIEETLDYYDHRLAELTETRQQELGNPKFMEITDLINKARQETSDQILTLLEQELDKALLTDEELDDCYFNPPTTIANEFLGYEEVNRHIAQAQLDKVKKILES